MKLIIKPEFDKKLKKLGIKTRFLKNFKKEHANPEISLQLINNHENFYGFIDDAFVWDNTPEGYDYWHEISKKIIES